MEVSHMRLGFELTLEQSQKLIMTPELRQAIQMLQFTSQELTQYLEKQMETNPLLEIESKESNEESIDAHTNKQDDIDWKEYIGQYDDISYKNFSNKEDKEYAFENYIATETSLKDHLLFQLHLALFDEKEKEIGEFIIESIDKNGYLNNSLEDLSRILNVNQLQVESVLSIIQTFDPIGVGARDLKECLMIQLKANNIEDPNAYLIVENHLEDLGQNRISKISKELNLNLKSIQVICDLIKSLQPKPGSGFAHVSDEIKFIASDVSLQYIDGEYVILVNDITAPRLTISSFYKELLSRTEDQNITEFLTQKLNSAMWMVKSIEQRRSTIYKVVEAIVKFQQDFFDKGRKSLKPLTLKEVADYIGVHESTVSRATSGKYIQTPRGIYELKFFFSSGVSSDDGGIAATSIKSMIKELIDKEDAVKPFSDQQIVNMLKEKNIIISRRTVAKYRDELRIPSSSGRRRF